MSELRKMTRMGGDLRKIARLLQDKGRNGDTILAHINPREAALLREQGGAGDINPETGLPEFYDEEPGFEAYQPLPSNEEPGFENYPSIDITPEFNIGQATGGGGIDLTAGQVSPQDMTGFRTQAPIATPTSLGLSQGVYGQDATLPPTAGTPTSPQPAEKGFLESLTGPDKLRLGLGLAGGVQTAMSARKARQGSQQGADQIRQLGRPYQERGLAEQSAASRGELNPVGQQQLDAMRARASQSGVARGGVGVAQQQRAEEDLRQRLLAAQQDFGLKLSGIGDQYTMKAIQEGIRADSEISNLFSNYYGNLTRLAAPTIVQATQPAKV
jgi:hypothetical protein